VNVAETGEVEVKPYKGSGLGTGIELTGGDTLVATTDSGDAVTLEPDDGVVMTYYVGEISSSATTVSIALNRGSGESASSTTAIPELADITSPMTVSRQDDEFELTWDNPDNDGFVCVFVNSCADIEIEPQETKTMVPDFGSHTLSVSEILAEGSADCATIILERRFKGQADPALHSESFIRADRYQRFEISITD
jgi:hypothetical protein